MSKITINEFVRREIQRLEDFKEFWALQQDRNGLEDWPVLLGWGDWDDQYRQFTE